jgi:hypothetical protein
VTEPLVEPEEELPERTFPPVDPERELARKNMVWGWSLFLLFLVLAVGTVVVAFIYLAVD